MTKITFYKNDQDEIVGFKSEGHSDYAVEGEDIVCAAVSVLVINTINSITELTDTKADIKMNEKKACIDVSFYEKPGKEADLLLRSLILGLECVTKKEERKKFVNLIFEEV